MVTVNGSPPVLTTRIDLVRLFPGNQISDGEKIGEVDGFVHPDELQVISESAAKASVGKIKNKARKRSNFFI